MTDSIYLTKNIDIKKQRDKDDKVIYFTITHCGKNVALLKLFPGEHIETTSHNIIQLNSIGVKKTSIPLTLRAFLPDIPVLTPQTLGEFLNKLVLDKP